MPQKPLILILITVIILLGAGLVSIAELCAYTPADRTVSIAPFLNGVEIIIPEVLTNAAQADAQRELGIKGDALPGSLMVIYACEGENCALSRLTHSLAIAPRCPLASERVTTADYDFQLDEGQVVVSSRAVVASLDKMVADHDDAPTTLASTLDIVLAHLNNDFRAAFPAFSVSLNAVENHWDITVQPADPTSSFMLFYQIDFDGTIIRGVGDS